MKTAGTVKWFSPAKGYGFVTPDNAVKDVFIHRSALEAENYDTLDDNQRIEFDIEEKQGKPSAINITKIGN